MLAAWLNQARQKVWANQTWSNQTWSNLVWPNRAKPSLRVLQAMAWLKPEPKTLRLAEKGQQGYSG
jgi:hypothetical protein